MEFKCCEYCNKPLKKAKTVRKNTCSNKCRMALSRLKENYYRTKRPRLIPDYYAEKLMNEYKSNWDVMHDCVKFIRTYDGYYIKWERKDCKLWDGCHDKNFKHCNRHK